MDQITSPQARWMLPGLLALAMLSGCATGPQEQPESETRATRSGMSGGLSLKGGAGPAVFSPPTDSNPNFVGSVEDSSLAWNIGVSLRATPMVGFEIGYVDLGEFSYDGTWLGTPDSGTVETDGYKAAVLGFMPLTERLEGYAKLGVYKWSSTDHETFGGAPITTKDDGTGLVLGVGVQTRLTDRLDMQLEFERYNDVADDNFNVLMLNLLWYPGF